MLGILEDSITSAEAFLDDFMYGRMTDIDGRLQVYFTALGASFLQAECSVRLKQPYPNSKTDAPP